ncbi:MAG TPA: MerR family transcriptional regulator [Burkholderiaceae bacterium]|nr:MerR family transcriptional regulator [Burkholderiaceae bacterium]
MLIGELAALSGLSHDTLRFYERQGLLQVLRTAKGYRRYGPEAAVRLTLIRLAQGLGFSLAEIREVLTQMDALQDGTLEVSQVRALLQGKLAEIDTRLEDLHSLRTQLADQLVGACPLHLQVVEAR